MEDHRFPTREITGDNGTPVALCHKNFSIIKHKMYGGKTNFTI